MPYSPMNQLKGNSIIVEDARRAEKEQHERGVAEEVARMREAEAARGPQPSLLERLRRLFRR